MYQHELRQPRLCCPRVWNSLPAVCTLFNVWLSMKHICCIMWFWHYRNSLIIISLVVLEVWPWPRGSSSTPWRSWPWHLRSWPWPWEKSLGFVVPCAKTFPPRLRPRGCCMCMLCSQSWCHITVAISCSGMFHRLACKLEAGCTIIRVCEMRAAVFIANAYSSCCRRYYYRAYLYGLCLCLELTSSSSRTAL